MCVFKLVCTWKLYSRENCQLHYERYKRVQRVIHDSISHSCDLVSTKWLNIETAHQWTATRGTLNQAWLIDWASKTSLKHPDFKKSSWAHVMQLPPDIDFCMAGMYVLLVHVLNVKQKYHHRDIDVGIHNRSKYGNHCSILRWCLL